MTKEEELESKEFGYKDDKIFLLSIEEYEKYKDIIAKYCVNVKDWWWLRTPGSVTKCVSNVDNNGSVYDIGFSVHDDTVCVRPAFKFPHESKTEIGEYKIVSSTFFKKNPEFPVIFNVVKIANGEQDDLYISDVPLFWDKFDDNSDDYESSHIRQKLLKWWWENLS